MRDGTVTRYLLSIVILVCVVASGRAVSVTAAAFVKMQGNSPRGGSAPSSDFQLAGVHAVRRDSIRLDTVSLGLVFVYEPSCDVCNLNINAWMDLAHEAQRRALPIYGVGVADSARALQYWGSIAPQLILMRADTADLVEGLRVSGTPTTLLVSLGVQVQSHTGPISRGRISALTQAMDSLLAGR